jgi:DNA-binding transcriptional MerR regulator
MKNEGAKELTLKELAAEAGVPERTIRFYICRGLVDPPLRGGRGAAYGKKHKARLAAIRTLQSKGNTLAEIAHALAADDLEGDRGTRHTIGHTEKGMVWFEQDGRLDISGSHQTPPSSEIAPGSAPSLPESEIWRAYAVAPDVRVMMKTGLSPWRTKALISALRRFAAEISK